MKTYSIDLRQKILEAYQNQEDSQRQLAKRFKVSLSFIEKLLKQYRETGSVAPRQKGKGFVPKLAPYTEIVEKLVEEKNDATLKELQTLLENQTGIKLDSSNLCRFLQKRQLTLKKNCQSGSSSFRKSPKSSSSILATSERSRTL